MVELNLGEEIVVTGRYKEARNLVVSDRFNNVRITERYELDRFKKARKGFVVGKRSIVKRLIHELRERPDEEYTEQEIKNYDNWITGVQNRETVYLVACDMRGLMYVPESEIIPWDILGDARTTMELCQGWSKQDTDLFFSQVK